MFGIDAAYFSISGLAALELVLAVRMSLINIEQMNVTRAAVKGKEGLSATDKSNLTRSAAETFLRSTYYKSWSRAQLNNTEYAPMLALLCFIIRYKADQQKRDLTNAEAAACLASFGFSLMFCYAAATQGRIDHQNLKPGRGGMSPFRPVGAFGRYISMAALIVCALTA